MLHTDSSVCELKWLMSGEREGLAVVYDVDQVDLERDGVKPWPSMTLLIGAG